MNHQFRASSPGPSSGPSRNIVLLGAFLLGAGLVWVIAVAPSIVALAVTVVVAAAWCRWLERHPDASGDS